MIRWGVKNMEWKGCPKCGQRKAAILDFKMADPKIIFFRFISAEKAPRVLFLGAKYMLSGSTNILVQLILELHGDHSEFERISQRLEPLVQ